MLDAQIVMMIGVAQMANVICHLPCHFLITCIHCDLLILIFVHLTLKLAFVQGAAKKRTLTKTAISQKRLSVLVQNFSMIICKGCVH